ncbi:MAG: hypothetical protein GX993_06780 [Bacteroidales bacterium]|nr:hypothetical protein [Bacteroidales bacterium]
MKKILSLVIMSLLIASCDSLKETIDEYGLYGDWSGEIKYEIMSENDYFVKSLIFSDDSKKCTVYTGISFLNSFDQESLNVRKNGANELILTEKGNTKAIYKIYLTKSSLDSFEMKWENHTKIEREYIPEKSLTITMKRPLR